MKTIEIAVRFTFQVPDETANIDDLCVDIPHGVAVVDAGVMSPIKEAKLIEYETMNVEELSGN